MKIGIMSDIHLFNKTINAERAFSKLHDVELLLIVGDIADHASEKQYDILVKLIADSFQDIPIYCVSGNHDNPTRNDVNYRKFEAEINSEYSSSIIDVSGAFYKYINTNIDLIGLNPVYHQKQFFFSNKGEQLAFLKEKLNMKSSKYHIVLCHPPLITHNPQRTEDMSSYIARKQDKWIQKIIDDTENVIFISGHTHLFPTVEFDAIHNNIYINNGSICPTLDKGKDDKFQQGNITLLEINENGISIIIKGIYTEKVFMDSFIKI